MSAALIARLRYQLQGPRITTMGPCFFCYRSSRGGETCADCLTDELAKLCGESAAKEIARAMRHEALARWAKEDAIERAQA